MTWVRIDDGFADHPKIVAAGPIAALIQIRALCYSARHLTDGFLPSAAVPGLLHGLEMIGIETGRNDMMVVGEDATDIDWPTVMVTHRLWERRKGGYYVHDFLAYNRSRADVLAERKARSKAGASGAIVTNSRRWGSANQSARAAASADPSADSIPSPPSRPTTNYKNSRAVDSVDNSPAGGTQGASPRTPVDSAEDVTLSQDSKRDVLTQEELKGLPIIAQARGITLAQARSELVTTKLRDLERHARPQ